MGPHKPSHPLSSESGLGPLAKRTGALSTGRERGFTSRNQALGEQHREKPEEEDTGQEGQQAQGQRAGPPRPHTRDEAQAPGHVCRLQAPARPELRRGPAVGCLAPRISCHPPGSLHSELPRALQNGPLPVFKSYRKIKLPGRALLRAWKTRCSTPARPQEAARRTESRHGCGGHE